MFGKLASLLWDPGTSSPQSDKSKDGKPSATSKDAAPIANPPLQSIPALVPGGSMVPGQVDSEMLHILEEAVLTSNLPGFDYIEFRDSLVRMQGVPMTEEQKFQAVYATAQSMGVTKQVLLDAIDHYLKIIASKDSEFLQFVAEITKSRITSVEATLAKLLEDIEAEANEIKRLTESIQNRRRQQDELNVQLLQAKQEIQNKQTAYEATRNVMVSNLTADRTKIGTYLK
jgi:uncharacterized protein YdaU (DUF1376 family)